MLRCSHHALCIIFHVGRVKNRWCALSMNSKVAGNNASAQKPGAIYVYIWQVERLDDDVDAQRLLYI